MHFFLEAIGYGIVTGSVLAIAALGLSLQYAVDHVPNFAHGDLLIVAAYVAWAIEGATGDIVLAYALGVVASGCAAWLLNRAVVEPFRKRHASVVTILIATVGASFVIENAIQATAGANFVTMPTPGNQVHNVGPFAWTTAQELVIIIAVAVTVAFFLIMRYTMFGKAQRAVSDSATLAQVTGVRALRIIRMTWFFDGLLAGLGGTALVLSTGTFIPSTGFNYLLPILAAAVVGGLGKPLGAIVGAMLVGICMELAGAYLAAEYKLVFAFLVLGVALIVRPQGIFRAIEGQMI